MKANPNIRSTKQFKGGNVPRQPVDEFDRVDRKEPGNPKKARNRSSVAPGFQSQARPGLQGMSDYTRKKS